MARAARACVAVMFPPPIRPMRMVMRPSVSMIGRDKVFVRGFSRFGSQDGRGDQDAVAESDAGAGSQGKIQLFFAIAENFLAEWVWGEQAVTASVPVCRKAGILGVVENGNGAGLAANHATEIAPAAASPPGGVASFSFAGEVGAVDAGVIQLGDCGGVAAGVRKHFGLVRGNFERADDAKA